MESVAVSPSVSAEKPMTPGEARQDLLTLFRKSYSYGGPLNITNGWTFCACCGSQYMDKYGKLGISAIPGWVRPSLDGEDAKNALTKKYGPDALKRFGPAELQQTISLWNRYNKPGVTVAAMEVQPALEILYDEQKRQIAEGYEIHDEDQGHVVSVIWINE